MSAIIRRLRRPAAPAPGARAALGAAVALGALALLACGEIQGPRGGDGNDSGLPVAWAAVSAGGSHTCGLARSGDAFCWGAAGGGQLGTGAAVARDSACGEPCVKRPRRVETHVAFDTLVAGRAHTCGLDAAGDAYCWGRNDHGQLGDSTDVDRAAPTPVAADLTFETLAAGGSHTCGVTRVRRHLYCWGDNFWGQLGLGTRFPRDVRQPRFVLREARTVAAGRDHTCAVIGSRRVLLCWGRNEYGQLGLGYVSRIPETSPTPLLSPTASVSTGRRHTCATSARDGTASCWGWNDEGALGAGGESGFEPDPRAVAGAGRFGAVSAGGGHTCGLAPDGRLSCWGDDWSGQLGLGDAGGIAVSPAAVAPDWRFRSVSAGEGVTRERADPPLADLDGRRSAAHTCAVDRDDSLLCWGNNARGQLGDGTTADRASPEPVTEPEG